MSNNPLDLHRRRGPPTSSAMRPVHIRVVVPLWLWPIEKELPDFDTAATVKALEVASTTPTWLAPTAVPRLTTLSPVLVSVSVPVHEP